jgi:hypothetical protein
VLIIVAARSGVVTRGDDLGSSGRRIGSHAMVQVHQAAGETTLVDITSYLRRT